MLQAALGVFQLSPVWINNETCPGFFSRKSFLPAVFRLFYLLLQEHLRYVEFGDLINKGLVRIVVAVLNTGSVRSFVESRLGDFLGTGSTL